MASTSPSSSSGNSAPVDAAIAQFKAAADEAAVKSLHVSTEVTKINGVDNAIKKISPA